MSTHAKPWRGAGGRVFVEYSRTSPRHCRQERSRMCSDHPVSLGSHLGRILLDCRSVLVLAQPTHLGTLRWIDGIYVVYGCMILRFLRRMPAKACCPFSLSLLPSSSFPYFGFLTTGPQCLCLRPCTSGAQPTSAERPNPPLSRIQLSGPSSVSYITSSTGSSGMVQRAACRL